MDLMALFDERWEKIMSNSTFEALPTDKFIDDLKNLSNGFDKQEDFDISVNDPEKGEVAYHISLTPLKLGDDTNDRRLFLLHGFDLNQIKAMEDELAASKKALEEMTLEYYLQREDLLVVSNQIENLNNHLEAVLATVPSGVAVTDSNGKIKTWNRKAEEITGYTQAEVLGKALEDLIPFNEIGTEGECTIEPKNREKAVILLNQSRLEEDNEIDAGTVVSFIDITEKKRLEEKIRVENEYLSMVLDRTPIATITADSDGRVKMINPAARELLEIEEQSESELTLSGIFKTPIEVKDGKYQRINLTRGGGVTIPIMASVSTFESENELTGVVITLTDITDLEGIIVLPSKEVTELGESRYRIDAGTIYIFDEEKPSLALDVFADGVKHGMEGLCITRMNPAKIRARYGLENTPIIWLVKNKIPPETCLSPNELSLCFEMIDNFVKQAEKGLILIEGVEYLMTQNSFVSIHKFFQLVNDCVMPSDSSALVTLDGATLTTQEFHLIKREMEEIEVKKRIEDE